MILYRYFCLLHTIYIYAIVCVSFSLKASYPSPANLRMLSYFYFVGDITANDRFDWNIESRLRRNAWPIPYVVPRFRLSLWGWNKVTILFKRGANRKPGCDEWIALRGSLALCIRGITHAWPDRIFPPCLLPPPFHGIRLSFLLMHMSRSFLLAWTSQCPTSLSRLLMKSCLAAGNICLPRASLLPRQLPLTQPRSTQAPRFAANQY